MLICCVIALLFCITGNAKVPYIPKIINYSVSDYKAGNQNWAVSQGPGGKMYIGNNRGLLVFDGIHWDLVKLPNNLGVRALYISKDGRIYVGSFEEFGYFEMDDENDLIYHSLSSSEMNVYLNNDEFWTTASLQSCYRKRFWRMMWFRSCHLIISYYWSRLVVDVLSMMRCVKNCLCGIHQPMRY